MSKERDLYFNWLKAMAMPKRKDAEFYHDTLLYMHGIEFKVIHPNDRNRELDGRELRAYFRDETGIAYDSNEPASVLEVLLGLAWRCDDIVGGADRGTSYWFRILLENLSLDGSFNIRNASYVINKFNNREYENSEVGCLFPSSDEGARLADVELWYQMCWYLTDNYIL